MTTILNTAPSFNIGTTGRAIIDVGAYGNQGNNLAVQSDGKILIAGTSYNSYWPGPDSGDPSLIRLNTDGTLDTSFSGDGKAIFDIGRDSGYSYSRSLTVQADGKILIAGSNGGDFSLIRVNADGTLDTTFGADGKANFDINGSPDQCYNLTLQADGKILLAGYSYGNLYSDTKSGVIRLNADGTLDTSFSEDGKAFFNMFNQLGPENPSMGLTLQSDGKILIVGTIVTKSTTYTENYSDFGVARLNADGTLDTSFSGDGKAIVDLGHYADYAQSVAVQPDGKILVAGYSETTPANPGSDFHWTDFSLIRLNADGTLDTSFSEDGKAMFDIVNIGGITGDNARSLAVQADGKILVAGFSDYGNYQNDFTVIRLNADGTLDTSFSNDGKANFDFGGSNDTAQSLTVQADGKILIAGTSGGNFAAIRLNADGTLDTSFGNLPGSSLGDAVSYTEGTAAIVLDTSVAVYDAELAALNGGLGDYSGASVTLSRHGGASSQDVFSGLGNLSLSGGSAVLSGVTVGTVNNVGGTLAIIFNASATQARVNETLSSIGYSSTSDTPPLISQIDWLFSDGSSAGALTVAGKTRLYTTEVNDAPTGAVILSGTAAQGLTLAADISTLADPDGLGTSFSYQWLRAGSAINGATASTYQLVQADTGTPISVQVSYTDSCGHHEAVTSGIVLPHVSTQPSAGNDLLTGTSGNDTLNGGVGADTMTGGDGSDRYYVDNIGDKVIETNAITSTGGTDLVYSYLSAYTLGANVENGRILSSGTASLTGNSLANLLYAGAGNNALDGAAGTDTVSYQYATAGVKLSLASTAAQATGGSGSDTLLHIENLTGSNYNDNLTGNAGSNVLNGGAGADTMTGGDGNDTYYVDNIGDKVIETNAVASTGGIDAVYSSLSTYTLTANVENGVINTSAAANLIGNALDNVLYAGAGNNLLDGGRGTDTVSYLYATAGVTVSLATTAAQATGGSGTDTLYNVENLTGSGYADKLTGNAGNNYLIGGTGNDTLNGGAGDDVLVGGLGADNLTGGTGADKFIFNSLAEMGLTSTTRDTITDFKTSEGDKIDLQGLDANTALAGHQAFTFIGTVSTFTGDATGQLRFDAATHILYGSTNADTAAEFAIVLTGVDSLASTDLVL